MTDDPPCARCGRDVRLWGRAPEGRICRNCIAIRNSGPCGHCGEHRRIDGRDADGVAWCSRCRHRNRHGSDDAARRRLIVDFVTGVDPELTNEMAEVVLEATVRSRQSLRRLADRLSSQPGVFVDGPTTTLPVLDRFTEALIAAGAQGITTIHPPCTGCGRHQRWQKRLPGGTGQCSACWARMRRGACGSCGRARRLNHRDSDGRVVCSGCVQTARRRHALDELAADITAAVQSSDVEITGAQVVLALDAVEANVPGRAMLAQQLERSTALSVATHRAPRVARFLNALCAGGVNIPAACCEDCNGPAEPMVLHGLVVRCLGCAKRCPECGGHSKEPAKPRCGRCGGRPRGTCTSCGRVDRLLDDDGWCHGCRKRAEHRCSRCRDQTPLTWLAGGWICHRCALGIEVDVLLGPTGELSAPLARLREAIVAADNPARVRIGLVKTTGGRLLAQLATGATAITHEALDAHGDDRSVAHLRSLLVAVGALPAEERSINRLEHLAAGVLDGLADPQDRKVVRAWLAWAVLPRLRARAATAASMAHSANNARRTFYQVVAFINWLHVDGRSLRDCTQADLDAWFASSAGTRWLARSFLVWAKQRGHVPRPLILPPCPPRVKRPSLDPERRWTIARRLVSDDTLDADDRVAGALVVLYGQALPRITALTGADLRPGSEKTVIVNFGGNEVPIHEPFATLITTLPLRRTNGVTDQIASPWLFPGRHAGRPVGPVVLAGRMRAIGIEPRDMRNNARAQLAAEIPPALLGKLIGVSPGTATRWAAFTSANWTAYAADVASDEHLGGDHGRA